MSFPSYAEAVAWLESHVDFERDIPLRREAPSLENITAVLEMMARPHDDYATIHVTGTNGKGTTTTLTSALLAATGLRVGTYTSPDLHSINERIAINAEPISDSTFLQLLGRMRDIEIATGIRLTRFEILTAGALLHFSDEGVDVAVIEVGMGGTWDATNVINAAVSVLTNVSLDHTNVLGSSVEEIATDKVGIFRPGARAVLATTDERVRAIAESRANELETALWRLGEEFEVRENDLSLGGRLLSVRTPFGEIEDVQLNLHGAHQGVNAATAVVTTEAFLDRPLDRNLVGEVLATVTMPGRTEVVGQRPLLVLDGAHNPAGVETLVATLDGAFHVEGERRCVIGVLRGRSLDDVVRPLIQFGFSEFFCCSPNSPRAVPADEVAATVRAFGATASEHPSAASALAHARELSGGDDLIVVTGSLYLVGEIRSLILGVPSRH